MCILVTGIDFLPGGKLLHEINSRATFEHQLERRATAISEEELRRSDLVEAFNIFKDHAHAYLIQ